jgi:Fe-S-cluster-containing dehydrogenase component/anaerobic selenocysteine-containing dehydrogenase
MTTKTTMTRRAGPRVSHSGMSRRDFLRTSGVVTATATLAATGCRAPVELTVPFNERPEALVALGKPQVYTTVLDGTPVLVKTREGRPILVGPHPGHPSSRGLTLRAQASLMDLYDPDRAAGPLSIRRGQGAPVAADWAAIGDVAVRRLKAGGAVLLTGPLTGPAQRAAVDGLAQATGLRHVSYAPLESTAAAAAWIHAFGHARPPRPRLDRADVVVGFGADFIDDPADGLEADFGLRRAPKDVNGAPVDMSRFIQLEGRLSLTGANADERHRIRDSRLAVTAAAIAHELIVTRGIGPLAGDAAIRDALALYTPAAAAAAGGLDAGVVTRLAGELAAAGPKGLALASGPASESGTGVALELAVILINLSLSGYGGGLFDDHLAWPLAHGGVQALTALAADMRAGTVKTLIVAGANPVYDAPAGVDFAAALAAVETVVSLADRVDETAALADWLAPLSHPLEAWSDAALPGGQFAIQQPAIRPLWDTHGLLDVLVVWGAAAGAGGMIQAAAEAARPAKEGAPETPNTSAGYHFVRALWGARFLEAAAGAPGFEAAWNDVLRAGTYQAEGGAAPAARQLSTDALPLLGGLPGAPEGLELQLYPHHALADGRAANNGWLQEFQDPVTRATWGGVLSIAPRRFDEMGLENGDHVTVTTEGRSLTLPAYRHAGMHGEQVAAPLGLGRTACGRIGNGIGGNAYPLRTIRDGRTLSAGLPATIARAEGSTPLAIAQGSDVIDRDRRQLVPFTTLSEYEKDPAAGTEQTPGGPSLWSGHTYENVRWAMAIDLSKCNGCGKCTIGCQAENNIPVVGAREIRNGREMAWIRIDRYYDAPQKEDRWGREVWDGPLEVVEEPVTLFEPMLCQHCENAPCETVCPFVATMHSEDGLNQQIYNRCVGTRYCANNCPFKVRRYNWYEYSAARKSRLFGLIVPEMKRHADLNVRGKMQMKNNPEVTVRSRGVMEKCSFCIQRIREARAENQRLGKSKDEFDDGTVVPACMEVCPTGAIVFGDVNDPKHRVHGLSKDPRAMRILESVNVKPAISYLTKVRNDKS